jgi:hypothetical protein
MTEDRPLSRPPETAPPTRVNAPHYPSYFAATVSKRSVHSVVCATGKGQHHETRYNWENCRVALCAALFPMLPYGGQLLEA